MAMRKQECNSDVFHQNLNDLVEQLTNHHCALLRCGQFKGSLTISDDVISIDIEERGQQILKRTFDLSDRTILARLRATITTMQELIPASSAIQPAGGVA